MAYINFFKTFHNLFLKNIRHRRVKSSMRLSRRLGVVLNKNCILKVFGPILFMTSMFQDISDL